MSAKLKKVCKYKNWTIYQHSDETGIIYMGFLPDTSPYHFDDAEWEDTSLKALKEFIDCY